MTPHRHQKVMQAWVNGAQIEFLDGDEWLPCGSTPWFHPRIEYRVKPSDDQDSDVEKQP